MDWQQITALAIVAVAAAALGWGKVRRRPGRLGPRGGCGCAGAERPQAGGSIVFRARKGERPEVVVRMR